MIEKNQIIVLGGNKLHRGFESVKSKLGIEKVIVIDWNEHPDYVGDVHYQLDIKDYNGILKHNIAWDKVAFVYTSADIAVQSQIQLHRKLGLLTPTEQAIENALIKGSSRDCWNRIGILHKYSEVVTSENEFEDVGCKAYIFKPNCSSGSRNITILYRNELSKDNIKKAIHHAQDASLDSKCIIEEFVVGTEYTVDMLGDNYGNVAVYGISKKYHTVYNKTNKIATKLHYAPSDVDKEQLDRIARFGQACYRGIGLNNSFGHLEVIVSNDGRIVPVEIGARSSGYIATTLVDIISGKSYLGDYCSVIHGGEVKDGLNFDGTMSAMYYFYDIKPGRSVCDCNIMDFLPQNINSFACDRSAIAADKDYKVIDADHERYGYEILGGPSDSLNIQTIEFAEKKFNDKFIKAEMKISDKVASIPEALSVYINNVVYKMKRRGDKFITLSLGEAYFDFPFYGFEGLDIKSGYHYSESLGIPELRNKISEYYAARYNADIDAEKEILISAGSKPIIYMALQTILNPGEEVMIHEPAWLSYPEQIKLANGVTVNIPYDCPVKDFEKYISNKTRALIINNPNNPAGKVYSREELEYLYNLCRPKGIYIISDEAYSDFVVNDKFYSFANITKDKDGVIIVNSLSKNFGISGWRVGYVISAQGLIYNILKLNQHLITCASTILLMYLARHFNELLDYTLPQAKKVTERRNKIEQFVTEQGLSTLGGSSTFYMFVNIENYNYSSLDLTLYLIFKYHIAVVPGLAYGKSTERFIRIGVGTESDEKMKEAICIIKKVIDAQEFDSKIIENGLKELNMQKFIN